MKNKFVSHGHISNGSYFFYVACLITIWDTIFSFIRANGKLFPIDMQLEPYHIIRVIKSWIYLSISKYVMNFNFIKKV